MEQALCMWLENSPMIQKWAETQGAKFVVTFLKRMATKNPWILDIVQSLSVLIMVWGALPADLVQAHLSEPTWLAQYENMSTATLAFVSVNILAQIPNATTASAPTILPVSVSTAIAATNTVKSIPVSGKEKENAGQP